MAAPGVPSAHCSVTIAGKVGVEVKPGGGVAQLAKHIKGPGSILSAT